MYAAIRSWLDGRVELEKPPLLSERGRLTIVDVLAARSPQEHARLVEDWARDVWKAYAVQQSIARDWIRIALKK